MQQDVSTSTPEPSMVTAVWDFLCSLKLTIATLLLLAVTSIIGTVLPQDPGKVAEFQQTVGASTYSLLERLDLFDMYHSWWFLLLLALFSLNLICCSLKRLPATWKTVRKPLLTPDEEHFRTLGNADLLTIDKGRMEAREIVVATLAEHFAAPTVVEREGKIHLFAQKAPYARFGVYVTHLSILVIFAGAIIGSLFGYKAYVNIVEGTEVRQVQPRGSDEVVDLGFACAATHFPSATTPEAGAHRNSKASSA